MSYTPPYPGGWKDFPDTSTPIDAASLNTIDAGIAAIATGYRFVETLYFTTPGAATFTKATYPYLRAIRVRLVGAGGGGGGAATTGSNQVAAGSGGGGGCYAESFITDIAGLSDSVTVTVGGGGAGGSAGANNGSNGDASSFGSLVSGNGGVGGQGGAAVTPPNNAASGGNGATVGVGDLVIPGTRGEAKTQAINTNAVTSGGGGNYLSPPNAGARTLTGISGGNGRGYGDGGLSGANSQNQGTARAGGNGSDGIVIVELYA
jgi:hypothetical protein